MLIGSWCLLIRSTVAMYLSDCKPKCNTMSIVGNSPSLGTYLLKQTLKLKITRGSVTELVNVPLIGVRIAGQLVLVRVAKVLCHFHVNEIARVGLHNGATGSVTGSVAAAASATTATGQRLVRVLLLTTLSTSLVQNHQGVHDGEIGIFQYLQIGADVLGLTPHTDRTGEGEQ